MISKEILGVRVDFGLTVNEILGLVEKLYLKDEKSRYICTTNPEFIMEAQVDGRFKNIINKSDLSVPDGMGVLFARRYLEKVKKIKRDRWFFLKAFVYGTFMGVSSIFKGGKEEKISGIELTHRFCELSAKKGYTMFFLGGKPKNFWGKDIEIYKKEMAILTAEKMQEYYPGLKVVGAASKFSREERDDVKTVEYIKRCMNEKNVEHIDFLFVAYGAPKQEKWIVRNSHKIPAKVSIGLGGTFDFIMGHCKLPPNFFVKTGLEWFYRLFKQPWRIKRIVTAFPIFPLKVYKDSIKT